MPDCHEGAAGNSWLLDCSCRHRCLPLLPLLLLIGTSP